MSVLPIGISGETQYQISRSLRFNSSDSSYLNRTPSSAGNRKTWTWSGWVKRSTLGTTQYLFYAYGGNSDTQYFAFQYTTGDALCISGYTDFITQATPAVFRDASAWYHVVCAVDTTQATASNRIKIYVNGAQQTYTAGGVFPAQNGDLGINQAVSHQISGRYGFSPAGYADGYLTEVNFIDGQALTPSSFGETDPITGVWKPKKYTGSYGTNGFFLNFSDASSAAALGTDYSGNSNTWTVNNISVTAGSGNDSLVDVPTLWGSDTGAGGEVRGNYCTLNPLDVTLAQATISNGNLTASTATDINRWATASIQIPSSGKYYAEFTLTATGVNAGVWAGITNFTVNDTLIYARNGNIQDENSSVVTTVATYTTNDVVGIAANADSGTVTFYKNGTQVYSGSLAVAGAFFRVFVPIATFECNFGQRPFAYTAPSGFKALVTTNLPEPAIKQGDDYFNVVLWTGNGVDDRSITGVGFQPDMVWWKERSSTSGHYISDAVRGATKQIYPNATNAEASNTNELQAFQSDGFQIGSEVSINENTQTYVAWNWKANGTGVTNTDGTITSTVSANTTSGFSIVTYTGTGANATVGHGLGVAPRLVIVKKRSSTGNWPVYHVVTTAQNEIYLNSTIAATRVGATPTIWQDTNPTSTVFYVGTAGDTNENTRTFVAYCFAPVAGYSAFGSYVGTGSADGPMVHLGFRPRYILVKCSSGAFDWHITDTSRSPYNQADTVLFPNSSAAETNGGGYHYDLLSNGFKCRNLGAATNGNGNTYIYAAFAENPFKYSLAR